MLGTGLINSRIKIMLQIIPLDPVKGSFNCIVSVDNTGLNLYFELKYNSVSGIWLMTVRDTSGNDYITNQPLIPAENILEQYKYMGIGSAYILPVENTEEEYPSRDTLGNRWVLVWGDSDEQFSIE